MGPYHPTTVASAIGLAAGTTRYVSPWTEEIFSPDTGQSSIWSLMRGMPWEDSALGAGPTGTVRLHVRQFGGAGPAAAAVLAGDTWEIGANARAEDSRAIESRTFGRTNYPNFRPASSPPPGG